MVLIPGASDRLDYHALALIRVASSTAPLSSGTRGPILCRWAARSRNLLGLCSASSAFTSRARQQTPERVKNPTMYHRDTSKTFQLPCEAKSSLGYTHDGASLFRFLRDITGSRLIHPPTYAASSTSGAINCDNHHRNHLPSHSWHHHHHIRQPPHTPRTPRTHPRTLLFASASLRTTPSDVHSQ